MSKRLTVYTHVERGNRKPQRSQPRRKRTLQPSPLIFLYTGCVFLLRLSRFKHWLMCAPAVCVRQTCGMAISPAEVRRFDFERMECPACGERFVPVPSQPGVLSVMASLEKSRNPLQTGGWGRASFHASL